jgi:hypothetical protein
MSKMNLVSHQNHFNGSALLKAGKPSMPLVGKQPFTERKTTDPSSANPKGQRYPIPSFFEYRIKAKENDMI